MTVPKLAQWVSIVTVVSFFVTGGLLFGQIQLGDTLSGGPYAQNPNNLNSTLPPDPTAMNMVWYTGQSVPSTINCKIQYRGVNDTDCPVGSGNPWCIAYCSDQLSTLTKGTVSCAGSSPCLKTRYELQLGVPGKSTNPPLTPGKVYYYTLFGNGPLGPVQLEPDPKCSTCTTPSFETLSTKTSLPPPPYSFEFVVFGDSGDSSAVSVQAQMATNIAKLCPQLDFALHVGDIIYPGGCGGNNQQPCQGTACGTTPITITWTSGACQGYPNMYFQPYHNIIRDVPDWTALGNHDSDFFCPGGLCCTGSPYCSNPYCVDRCGGTKDCSKCPAAMSPCYLNVFSLPSNGPTGQPVGRNYFFDFGTARFIFIDSNAYQSTLQVDIRNWLDSVLTDAQNSNILWKFVIFHHSAYSSGPHGVDPQWGGACNCRDGMGNFVPSCPCVVNWLQATGSIVDTMANRVDIVFTGHDHNFEFVPAQRGTKPFYIVTGMGGSTLTPASRCDTAVNKSCFSGGVYYGLTYYCTVDGTKNPTQAITCPKDVSKCKQINSTDYECPGVNSFTVVNVLKNATAPTDQVRIRQKTYDGQPILDWTFDRQ